MVQWFFKGLIRPWPATDTWFKVIAHFLPYGTLYGKYKPDWAEGRENMLRTSDVGWTDGWMDRLPVITKRHSLNRYCLHIKYLYWHFIVHILVLPIKVFFFTCFTGYLCPFTSLFMCKGLHCTCTLFSLYLLRSVMQYSLNNLS